MLRIVALVRTDVSEERRASINRISAKNLRSVLRLLVTVKFVPIHLILVTLMMEAIRFPETSVPPRATWRNIPEDAILHSHCRENLKSYTQFTDWTL
jgi:hypothetical protein